MEKLIADLKQVIAFKDSTDVGDLVLIVAKEPQVMASYALVTSIERDVSRRNEWWHVGMTLLSLPPQKITWTLRTPQFTGMEVFTMGGEQRFVKAVDFGLILPDRETFDGLENHAAKPGEDRGGGSEVPEKKQASFLKRVK